MVREGAVIFKIPDGAFDKMAEHITRNLKRDVDKKKQIQMLLRKAAKYYYDVVKMTSIPKYHSPRKINGVPYRRGNLSREMRYYNGKSRTNITVSVGPTGDRHQAPSGFYAAWITKGSWMLAPHVQKPFDWKGEALRKAGQVTRETALEYLEKYMKSKLKRLRKAGFKVD